MSQEIYTALTLFGVGMITVFVVLLLVVITGNALIWFVNKYFDVAVPTSPESGIEPRKIAAINAAVEIFTQGQGTVEKIEKKNTK